MNYSHAPFYVNLICCLQQITLLQVMLPSCSYVWKYLHSTGYNGLVLLWNEKHNEPKNEITTIPVLKIKACHCQSQLFNVTDYLIHMCLFSN